MKRKRYTPFLFLWTYTFPSQFVYICLIIFNGCVTLHCVGDYNWYHKCWEEGKYIKMCVYISRAWNKAQITSNTSCFWEGNWVADFGLSLFGARVWFQVRELRSNKLSSGPHPNTINKTKRMGTIHETQEAQVRLTLHKHTGRQIFGKFSSSPVASRITHISYLRRNILQTVWYSLRSQKDFKDCQARDKKENGRLYIYIFFFLHRRKKIWALISRNVLVSRTNFRKAS